MKKIFNFYAAYYDNFYKNKKYQEETKFIINILKSHRIHKGKILDFGCGTGEHAICFYEKNFEVTGVDMSKKMIAIAAKKIRGFNKNNIQFKKGDVKTIRMNTKFKIIVSLFHVFSYQISNLHVNQFLLNANRHLQKNGLLIFDFWYGPGIVKSTQKTRSKKLNIRGKIFKRTSNSTINFLTNSVKVNIKIQQQSNQNNINIVNENHEMRYFFIPEIEFYLKLSGFKLLNVYRSFYKQKPSTQDWNAVIVAKKIK